MSNDRDPWKALAAYNSDINVFIRVLPERWGQTIWPANGAPYIELSHDLGRVQQRCTLAHELHHLTAGRPCKSLCSRNERDVVEATARWLLPDLDAVGEALRKFDIDRAATVLDVTRRVLNDRLHALTKEEETQLAAMLPAGRDDSPVEDLPPTPPPPEPKRGPRARAHRCEPKTNE